MATLSPKEIAVCIAAADWGPAGNQQKVIKFLDTAIAVCKAESGGRTNAVSSTGDYGLWQINKQAHPDAFAEGDERLNDPFYNTTVAKDIWQAGQSGRDPWDAWTGTYKSGKHRAYLGSGARAYRYLQSLSERDFYLERNRISVKSGSGRVQLGELQEYADIPTDPLGKIGFWFKHGFDDFGDKLVTGAKSAGFFLLAIVLVILGVLFLLKDSAGRRVFDALKVIK